MAVNLEDYRHRRTLILGEVASGKTRLSAELLEAFAAAGPAEHIALIDLAPDPVGPVGGKMRPPHPGIRYITCPIVPPRLTGRNEAHIAALAAANARRIERLMDRYLAAPREILFVNDATLYLQAGSLARFGALLDSAPTAVVNAYAGVHFADGPLTRRERRLTAMLSRRCDRVIRLSPQRP
jgi:hypothetical protein